VPGRVEVLNDELHDVCCSLSIIRVVGWAVHVERVGRREVHTGFCWGTGGKETTGKT